MNTSKIAIACRTIAAGFEQLAEALDEPDVAGKPAEETKAKKPPKAQEPAEEKQPDPPAAEEDDEPFPKDDEVDEVTMEDLQNLGASLLKAKKRTEFVAILDKYGIKNLSAAKKADYKKLWDDLKAAA